MADAITGPPLATAYGNPVAADAPLAVQIWEGRSVRLGEVIAALPELRHQASARDAGTRTAVMTIVMVIGPDDDPEVDRRPRAGASAPTTPAERLCYTRTRT